MQALFFSTEKIVKPYQLPSNTLWKNNAIENSASSNETTTTNSITTTDDLLLDLQPLFHCIAHILRLLQWRNTDSKYSLTLLLSWIAIRSLHDFVLYLLPILFLAVIVTLSHTPAAVYQQNCEVKENEKKRDDLQEDLTEIYNAFNYISSIKTYIQKSDTLCNLYHKYYSVATVKQRLNIYLGVACLFIMTYVEWVILIQQQIINSCASTLWFFVLVVMCSNSPWTHSVLNAIFHAILPFIYHFMILRDNTATDKGDTTSLAMNAQQHIFEYDDNMITKIKEYRFEVYHHQRWWFPTGWSNLLLPQDRPVWSDIHLEPTPSIQDFKLPPTTIRFDNSNQLNQQKILSWAWVDPIWSKEHNNKSCDNDGWQYGNWNWKSWSFQSSALGICTRRQKWVRHAQIRETWVQHNDAKEGLEASGNDYCNSFGGGSDTTFAMSEYSSVYDWDDTTSTYSSLDGKIDSTLVPKSIVFKPPTLITNVVNIPSRRSSHSAIFNTPILFFSNNNLETTLACCSGNT